MQISNSINNEIAYAKINLALHIMARRDDGYHDIDTVFAFLRDGDALSISSDDILSLSIDGPFGDRISGVIDDNLIIKTAKLMQSHFNINGGAALHLRKNLPIASGIGGGSADAAAAARLLNSHWGINCELSQLAELITPLGADIAACVMSEISHGSGIGTNLRPLSDKLDLAGLPILLINPMVCVSTGSIFAAWDGQSGGALEIDLDSILYKAGNDMQRAAISLFPQIQDVIDVLDQQKPMMMRMSGSGATCFALFKNENDRDIAQENIEKQRPDWWFLSSELK